MLSVKHDVYEPNCLKIYIAISYELIVCRERKKTYTVLNDIYFWFRYSNIRAKALT